MFATNIFRSIVFIGKCHILAIADLYEMADIVATEQVS
jgi:hypothetical protein